MNKKSFEARCISIQDISNNEENYPRNVTLVYNEDKKTFCLLGNLPHNTQLKFTITELQKMINLLKGD